MFIHSHLSYSIGYFVGCLWGFSVIVLTLFGCFCLFGVLFGLIWILLVVVVGFVGLFMVLNY